MGEQFIVNDAAQDMSDGNVHFLNPGRFGVLYNQRVIAKFLAPSSIPSQEPYGGDAHRLCLLQGMLYVGRVAAGRKAYQNITFRSQGCCLPFEDAVEAIIIADCGQDGSVGCHAGVSGAAGNGGPFGGFGGEGMSMDDIFSMFGDIFGGRGGGFSGGFGGFSGFGGGGGGSQQRRYRGSDLRVKVKMTLKEISTGVEKKFKLKKYVPCNHCHGTGAEGDGGSEICPTCKGSGSVIRNQQTILGTMQTRTTCPTCNGEGKIIKNKCKECGGDGIVYGEEVVTVKIPAGVAEGMQLSMGGKGNAGKHNGVPGDLLILVEEEPHPDLIRDENDLIYNLLLSFPTAALGGAVEIPTIDGKVKVKIDSGTQPGKVLRLRGKGLPNVNGYGTGDLLVNISIYVPEALNKEEKSTLEKMEASDNFKPSTSVKEKIFKKFKSFFD